MGSRHASLAVLVAVAMALFPPWVHTAELGPDKPAHEASVKSAKPEQDAKSAEEEKGKEAAESKEQPARRELHVASTYAWIGMPPRPPKDWPVPENTYWSVGLDTQRLILQYGLLLALCVGIWLVFFSPEDE